ERQAAATDALRQAGAQPLELGDPLVDPGGPAARQAGPVAAGGGPIGRQLGELVADLLEGQADALGEHDEGDPAQDGSAKAAVTGPGSLRADQPPILLGAQPRRPDVAR